MNQQIKETPDDQAELPYRPCVGLMIFNAVGDIFVGKRIKPKTKAWQMPQGGIDEGEDVITAGFRELAEETGISRDKVEVIDCSKTPLNYDIPKNWIPDLWQGRFRGQSQHWLLLRFMGKDSDVNIATEHPEFRDWKWQPIDQLVDNILPFKRTVYRKVIQLFSATIKANSS